MTGFLHEVMGFIGSGGYVMPPLVASALVLWYALGDRALRLRPGHIVPRARDRALAVTRRGGPDLEPRVEAALGDLRAELRRGRTVVRAVVMVAPLAGLLGTVAGMIETFDGLGDSALFSRTGGVAGGISQALLTTQMGLVVAVPGVIAGRLLDRRQRSLDAELIRIRALAVVGDLA